jgi:hypothetical protein
LKKALRFIEVSISISARKNARKKKSQKLNTPAEIEHAANMLTGKKPTPFSLEGWLVETVRRNRCLQGWSFAKADEAARGLALAALSKIGWGTRPKFLEGQPFLTSGPKTCPTCGEEFVRLYGPGLDRFREAGSALYCSFSCLRESIRRRQSLPENLAKRYAWRERRSEAFPPKLCEHCGESFHPRLDQKHQRFCSPNCFDASRAAEQHESRTCQHCNNSFTPEPGVRGANRKFCSIPCRDAARISNPPRRCIECGDVFQPRPGKRGEDQKFCGPDCYKAHRKAAANLFICEAA